MAWYYGTYSCGHEGRVNVIGPGKDRQWKIDREFEGMCPDCYKKWLEEEKERKNKEAESKSESMELPELTGTEKQVKWAVTLRVDFIENIDKKLTSWMEKTGSKRIVLEEGNMEDIVATREEIMEAIDYGCSKHTEAKFWIDRRDLQYVTMIYLLKELREKKKEEEVPDDVRNELEEEKERLTVKPEETSKGGIVELKMTKDGNLAAIYVKDEKFREIAKEKNFTWSGTGWEKAINEYSGDIDDRAAEIGNALISNGFTVRFFNGNSKQKAISGTFEKEQRRWIKWNDEKKKFAICWNGYNSTLYNAAKKLPGAYWDNGNMKVAVEFYKELEDFAETMEFTFSKKALKEKEKYLEMEERYQIENVEEKVQEEISDEERLRKSLKESGTIIEDLKDEA